MIFNKALFNELNFFQASPALNAALLIYSIPRVGYGAEVVLDKIKVGSIGGYYIVPNIQLVPG